MKNIISSFSLILIFSLNSISVNSQTVEEVIEQVHSKYSETHFKNVSFMQNTIFYGLGERVERTQIWYQALSVPGKQAIKFDDKGSNNGILFRDGLQYGYANGELIQKAERLNEVMILGFDMFVQPVTKTLEQLDLMGIDYTLMYEDEWQSRAVYVIGVSEPNLNRPQFWLDKEELYLVKTGQIGRESTVQEAEFGNYMKENGYWFAREILIRVNGQKALLQEYSEIVFSDSLNQEVFIPESFPTVAW